MKKFILLVVASLLLATTVFAQKYLKASITSYTNILCTDDSSGSATVTASFGSPPYTYLWIPYGGTNATANNLSAGNFTVMVTDNYPDTINVPAIIAYTPLTLFNIARNNVACFYDSNGSANVSAVGGNSSYEYSWSNGATTAYDSNLRAGTYTVTVTDSSGCSASLAVPILVKSSLFVQPTIGNVSCFGYYDGTATASVTGGIGPYSYLWEPAGNTTATITGLGAGMDTLQVTDRAGCRVTAAAAVSQPPPLVLTPHALDSLVYNYVSGGTAPYTYQWYPVGGTRSYATGLSAGVYTVTVHDNHYCSDSITVDVPAALSTTALYLGMGPPTATCGDTDGYVTWPVIIKANHTIFNSCALGVYYPSSEFAGDVYNSGITVTRGPKFQPGPGNDYDSLSVVNLSDSVLEIRFGSPADSSPNGAMVSSDETLLLIKLKIQSCTPALVQFTNNTYNDTMHLNTFETKDSTVIWWDSTVIYTNVPYNCNPYVCGSYNCSSYCCQYDLNNSCLDSCYTVCYDTCYDICDSVIAAYNVNPQYSHGLHIVLPYNGTTYYNIGSTGAACPLKIFDFNSPVNAGVGDTLTITGNSFGNPRGTGRIEFENADMGGGHLIYKLNPRDYINWTNTQIEIRVPSFADSTTAINPEEIAIGGGDFVVQNTCGNGAVSHTNSNGDHFSVFYNLSEYWNLDTPPEKTEKLLRAMDTNRGYVLRLNPTDFPQHSYRRNIFVRAMKDWTCYTGMNWSVGTDTVINYTLGVPTHHNYICFTNSLPPTTAARTYPVPEECTDFNDYLKEGDMYFNSNTTSINFIYDTTGADSIPPYYFDFYGVCLHELGHFIGLEHDVIDTNLMYYADNYGPILPAMRLTLARGASGSAVAGGIYSVHQGANVPTGGSCFSLNVMTPKGTSCTNDFTGIKQISNNANFVIYPNPSQGMFTIESTMNDYTLIVTNMLGQRIFSKKVENEKTEINLSTVASGMYFVQEQYKNGIATQKLIITKK